MSNASLIPIIISTASTIISLIMLILTRQDMNRRERKDQEMFIENVYERFQEQKLTMLQDRDSMEILALDTGKGIKELKLNILSSVRINQAHLSYRLYQNGYLRPDQWEEFRSDIELLFTQPSIQQRWDQIQQYYQPGFRTFINEDIL